MANEFKVKKGLIVNGSGGTLLDAQGSVGQVFSVTDSLTGDIFSVSDISGIPILNVNSNGTTTLDGITSIVSGGAASPSGVEGLHLMYDTNHAYIKSENNGSTNRPLTFLSSAYTFSVGNATFAGDIYGKSVNNAYSSLYKFGGIYFTWDSDSYGTNLNHSITSTSNGSWGDNLTINSYGKVRINFDSNNNDSGDFSIGNHTTGTSNTLFTVNDTSATFAGDVTLTDGVLTVNDGNNYVKISEGSNSIGQIELKDGNPVFVQGWGSEFRVGVGTYDNTALTINSSKNATFAGTGTFEGGGNTLTLKKGTGTAAIALGGASSTPEASALIEGVAGGGLKIYTSTSAAGTIADPGWSSKLTIAQNGNSTFAGSITAGTGGQFKVLGGGYIQMGNCTISKSGDSNHLHVNCPTALIPNSTTLANNTRLGTSAYRWKDFYAGPGNFEGSVTASADVIAYSDARLKENVKTLDGSKVLQMRGVSFDRKDTGISSSGVIAQEMQKIAPELVSDDDGTLGVAYGNLTGYLIEAIKDLKTEVEQLKKLIKNGNNL